MTNSTKKIAIRALKLLRDEGNNQTKKDAEMAIEDLETSFEVSSVSREDLEYQGFSGRQTNDSDMETLADKMGNAFCESGYWEILDTIADEYLHIPKTRKKNNF